MRCQKREISLDTEMDGLKRRDRDPSLGRQEKKKNSPGGRALLFMPVGLLTACHQSQFHAPQATRSGDGWISLFVCLIRRKRLADSKGETKK
mmetsp:Transcript_46496/g.91798  ORF Transcript_46496/g.91798 Transcript_46496/m.91798 type:complete len:92 (-) Transcript_46496:42-317(-)